MCYESLSVGKKCQVGVRQKLGLPRQKIGTYKGIIRTIDFASASLSAVTLGHDVVLENCVHA